MVKKIDEKEMEQISGGQGNLIKMRRRMSGDMRLYMRIQRPASTFSHVPG